MVACERAAHEFLPGLKVGLPQLWVVSLRLELSWAVSKWLCRFYTVNSLECLRCLLHVGPTSVFRIPKSLVTVSIWDIFISGLSLQLSRAETRFGTGASMPRGKVRLSPLSPIFVPLMKLCHLFHIFVYLCHILSSYPASSPERLRFFALHLARSWGIAGHGLRLEVTSAFPNSTSHGRSTSCCWRWVATKLLDELGSLRGRVKFSQSSQAQDGGIVSGWRISAAQASLQLARCVSATGRATEMRRVLEEAGLVCATWSWCTSLNCSVRLLGHLLLNMWYHSWK